MHAAWHAERSQGTPPMYTHNRLTMSRNLCGYAAIFMCKPHPVLFARAAFLAPKTRNALITQKIAELAVLILAEGKKELCLAKR